MLRVACKTRRACIASYASLLNIMLTLAIVVHTELTITPILLLPYYSISSVQYEHVSSYQNNDTTFHTITTEDVSIVSSV